MNRRSTISAFVYLAFLIVSLSGCQTLYLESLEQLGIEKREVLHTRVEKVKQSQTVAKEQFSDSLTNFKQLVAFDGGKLEKTYRRLDKSYQKTEARALEVSERIEAMDNVAKLLFEEWQTELSQYQNNELKEKSEVLLRQTENNYKTMLKSMWAAEAKMQPVLTSMHDQVLYLKHNLNAQALGQINVEVANIEKEVANLIQEMNKSIQSADKFIQSLDSI
ncbi:MAG TPA: DUF2959 domain-containing protein [Gammaproteobacteria bacterium]|nr:DUF2959 domain-containing protein [Gammaproteobacteria bacterium]